MNSTTTPRFYNDLFINPFNAERNEPLSYPESWKLVVATLANAKSQGVVENGKWNNQKMLKFMCKLYEHIGKSVPTMMAYRWDNEIFSNLKNASGFKVNDYERENNIVFKSIPIMDTEEFDESFFLSFGAGNLDQGQRTFSYGSCVIDLNPDVVSTNAGLVYASSKYGDLDPNLGNFPIRFTTITNPNKDEYKTSKIILQRVENISADNEDEFSFGEDRTYFDLVTDTAKLKYRDAESIVRNARDDKVQVKLGNGGSSQKADALYDLDLFNENGEPQYKMKKVVQDGVIIT